MSDPRGEQRADPSAPLYPTAPPMYPAPSPWSPAGYPPPPPPSYPYLYPYLAPYGQGEPSSRSMSQWAIWSLVCSLGCFLTSGLSAIPGVIFGHLALSEIHRYPWVKGRGMAIAGLVIGYLVLAVGALAVIFMVFALLLEGASSD